MRLADEDLSEMHIVCTYANQAGYRNVNADPEHIMAMIAEIRARRAADLSDEDAYAVRWMCGQFSALLRFKKESEVSEDFHKRGYRALAVLDRLLATTGGAK